MLGSKAEPVSHPLSDLPDLNYSGFCHGPAGAARALFELYKITSEPDYQAWAERLAQGVLQSNVPGDLMRGYWNVICKCCGSAAVIDLLVEMWAFTQRLDCLASAKRAARQFMNHETHLDGKTTRSIERWERVNPRRVSTKQDYFVGAAGVGSSLLRLHLAVHGKYTDERLPDNWSADAR
jgi:lantibiotic modifying enzyme